MSLTPDGPSADAIDAETLVRRIHEIVSTAKSLPLSTSVVISKDEVLSLLDEAIERLPEELRQARWMLKERDEFLDKVKREGDEVLDAARQRAERMVQRQEIVREAQRTAQRTIDDAQEEARRLRHEAEDYADQKLAGFEIVLERTMKTVQAGREKLRVTPLPPADDTQVTGLEETDVLAEGDFFDQDSL